MGSWLPVLAFVLVASLAAQAKSEAALVADSSSLKNGSIRLSAGIGAGMLGADVYGYLNNQLSNSLAFVQSSSVVPTVKAEYFIDKQSAFGLSYSYQAVTGAYYGGPSGIVPNLSEAITRSVIALSYQRYFNFRKHQQFFLGASIGIAVYKDAVTNSDPTTNYGYEPAPTTGHASMIGNSISVQGGYIYQVNDNFGLQAALGFGILEPYVFNLGVHYTFKKKLVIQ